MSGRGLLCMLIAASSAETHGFKGANLVGACTCLSTTMPHIYTTGRLTSRHLWHNRTCNWPYLVYIVYRCRICSKAEWTHTAQAGMPASLSLSHSEDMSGGASWPNTDAADITGLWVGASILILCMFLLAHATQKYEKP